MTAAPTTAAATKPAARPAQVTCPSPACMACKSLGNLSSPAPKMMGVDMRKLKRAISSRVKPWKSPSEMVERLRDTPGTSAAACATPRPKARPTVISSRWRVLRPARSAIQRMVPRAASVAAMRSGARKFASAQRSSSLPATAPGMAETTIPQKRRPAGKKPRRDEPDPILQEDDQDRRQRAPVQRHVEGKPRVFPAEDPGDERQMGARRDGQELGQPLHDAEDDGLPGGDRAGSTFPRTSSPGTFPARASTCRSSHPWP